MEDVILLTFLVLIFIVYFIQHGKSKYLSLWALLFFALISFSYGLFIALDNAWVFLALLVLVILKPLIHRI